MRSAAAVAWIRDGFREARDTSARAVVVAMQADPMFQALTDPAVAGYRDVTELQEHTLREIERFFQDYKALENKSVEVYPIRGADIAATVIREAYALYRREENRLRGWG